MTSEAVDHAYVWVWLPGHDEPVVCGRVDDVGPDLAFTYGRSYLARPDAMPLYLPELPLRRGPQRPPAPDMLAAGCIRDAAPDAWGQRVILHRLTGRASAHDDTGQVGLLTYLMESGSDRVGALDFQSSPTAYEHRGATAPLDQVVEAAARLQAGERFTPELERALLPGSTIGGARPKALLDDDGRSLIAKFSSPTDTFPWMPAEAVAMELARRVGLDVAPTSLTSSLGHDVLLVERFDRTPGARRRRMVVSAATMLQLGEASFRYGSYAELADVVRRQFTDPTATLRELFARIVFNMLVGNTDDHARNHSAFWDGHDATLTPAYDVCPQPRTGGEAALAMAVSRDGSRLARLEVALSAAAVYLLDESEARDIVDHQVTTIHERWEDACERVGVTAAQRQLLWGRSVCNPYTFEQHP